MTEKDRILIIDNDTDTLEGLSDILHEKGYQTETAKNGKEAIAKAEKRFFNVLIIDDDEDTLEGLSDILHEKGYQTETAKNGKEAIAKAEKRFFNVALVDVGLPDMTGVEVLQVFGKISPYTMNVIITGAATVQNAIESVNVGASAYLMKPIDHETLDKILDECLKKQQLLIFPNEVPGCLRKPKIRLLLQTITDEKITEFKPSISNEKGVFYREIEKIIPNPSEYYQVLEILEKYGILTRKRFDSVLACPSCNSIKISMRLACPSCRSTNINKQAGIFFKCNACGKEASMPEHIYSCEDCKRSCAEDKLRTKETFTLEVSNVHELLIKKWIEDLDNMLTSAQEFYRQSPPCESNRPKVSYSASKVFYSTLAKKGKNLRVTEEKSQE
ncbi:MAG: response regulator [Candidatus Bathyarchaeia archaeon]|jgi:DNA-binding response OmpR family regulator